MKFCFPAILFFLSIAVLAQAQQSNIKYGKIDPADLAMKKYAADTQANAVILSKTGWIHFDPTQKDHTVNAENHIVIKILTEAGIDEVGNAYIYYQSWRNYSRIGAIRAQVHLPDGTIVKVDKSDMFDEKTNRYVSAKKIAFPKLVVGAIIEYEYTLIFANVFQPVNWYFQDKHPIRYAELKTFLPEFLEYVVLTQGTPLDDQHQAVAFEALYNLNYITSSFYNRDVPALKTECCITTMNDYYTRVRFQLKAISVPLAIRREVMNSWEKLAEELYEMPAWGMQLTNKRPGQLVLDAAGIPPATSGNAMQAAQAIYTYINQSIQWDKTYDIGSSNTIAELLNLKSGSSGEMNKMLCAALTQAGIPARPVLLSTRDHGKMIDLYPFISQFNHMVVLASINNKQVWLDASIRNLPFGQLPENVLNGQGWVVDEKSPHWIEIIPPVSKSVFLLKGSIDTLGNLNGELECRFTGYHAIDKRALLDDKTEFQQTLVMNGTTPLVVDDLNVLNAEAISEPLQVKATIIDQPVATVTDAFVYINALFPAGMDELPFKLEERTYPVEMNYPSETSIVLSLHLPTGYVTETLPEPMRYSTKDNGIQVFFEASEIANKLHVTTRFVLTQLEFPPEEYQTLKNIYLKRKEQFTEPITLRKS